MYNFPYFHLCKFLGFYRYICNFEWSISTSSFIQAWSSQPPMFATIGKTLEGEAEKLKKGELQNTYSNNNQSKR